MLCARNGHKLRQPIGKGTPVDQCQQLVFIEKRKIRVSSVSPFFNSIPHCLALSASTKSRRDQTEPISTLFNSTAPGLFIAFFHTMKLRYIRMYDQLIGGNYASFKGKLNLIIEEVRLVEYGDESAISVASIYFS